MGLDSKGKKCQLGQKKTENKKGARGKAGLCVVVGGLRLSFYGGFLR